MSEGQGARRRPPRRKPKPPQTPQAVDPVVELWRAVPEPTEPDDITPATDPGALLRSLGTPPLTGHAGVAGHYLTAVAERAAGLATALAAAAELLADTGTDDS